MSLASAAPRISPRIFGAAGTSSMVSSRALDWVSTVESTSLMAITLWATSSMTRLQILACSSACGVSYARLTPIPTSTGPKPGMTSSWAAATASLTLPDDKKSVKTDWLYEARSSSLRSVRTFEVVALSSSAVSEMGTNCPSSEVNFSPSSAVLLLAMFPLNLGKSSTSSFFLPLLASMPMPMLSGVRPGISTSTMPSSACASVRISSSFFAV
mmetsp:Transcript_3824/g.10930  ORF Transcript_3824/g.10930 Transcript_3824/m.10930 type:complete len:213 (+) Transcript_3824:275-913(+)